MLSRVYLRCSTVHCVQSELCTCSTATGFSTCLLSTHKQNKALSVDLVLVEQGRTGQWQARYDLVHFFPSIGQFCSYRGLFKYWQLTILELACTINYTWSMLFMRLCEEQNVSELLIFKLCFCMVGVGCIIDDWRGETCLMLLMDCHLYLNYWSLPDVLF